VGPRYDRCVQSPVGFYGLGGVLTAEETKCVQCPTGHTAAAGAGGESDCDSKYPSINSSRWSRDIMRERESCARRGVQCAEGRAHRR
jgi:hypothetical protein